MPDDDLNAKINAIAIQMIKLKREPALAKNVREQSTMENFMVQNS